MPPNVAGTAIVPSYYPAHCRAYNSYLQRLKPRPRAAPPRATAPPAPAHLLGYHLRIAPPVLRVASQPVGNQVRVLDESAVVADHARNQEPPVRNFHILPNPPVGLVHWVRRLQRITLSIDLQNYVHNVAQRNVVFVRAVVA